MKPHFLMASLAAAAMLVTTGCDEPKEKAPTTQTVAQTGPAPMTSHSNEPIIIDNPDAFLGLLYLISEEDEVVGPFDDELTLILDHHAYKYLRLYQGSQPVELGDSKVVLNLRKNRGSVVIDHVGGGTGAILIASQGANGRPKWKRNHKMNSDKNQRLGLMAKNSADKYEIESIEYTPRGGGRKTEPFPAGPAVHISLCVDADDPACAKK